MDPRRPELHGSGFTAILEVAREELGDDTVREIVEPLGITVGELDDPNGWFSQDLASGLIGGITERIGNRSWIVRGMRRAFSPKHLGILYPLMRSFGTPGFLYGQIPRFAAKVNKVTDWSYEYTGQNKIRLETKPKPGAPPDAFYLCVARQAQAAQLATLFDLPPAHVEHKRCLHRGDDACVYDIEWKEHRRPIGSYLGIAGGIAAGSAVIATQGTSLFSLSAGGLLFVTGWALGRVADQRHELRGRLEDLENIHAALDVSSEAHEKRYGELLEAKAEVDAKVERATQQLSETLEEVRAMDRAKTDFFNNVSHELRSPLTLILAPLEDLVAGRPPPGGPDIALATMRRNAARLLHLINQLLDLAKLDAGEAQIAPTPINLRALVDGVMRGFESAAQSKDVKIVITGPTEMRDVTLDARWIESAVGNLLGNALKFTDPGQEVRVAIADNPDDVAVAISDSGPGIAPEDHDRVFERFAQTDISAKVVGGTGIGLALVREAARLHGGDVTLDSEPGRGATFTLILPRAQVAATQGTAAPTNAASRDLGQALAQPSGDAGVLSHPGPSEDAPLALVVEDNPDLRQFMIDTLGAEYRVHGSVDGQRGLELALELDPNVIVTDVAMPTMDGFELCRALRAQDKTRSTPILIVTARTDVSSVLEGFEAGASDYILKPFHGRELLARVDVHVRLRRLAQELALRERHATLGVIAASVAHQVRNPLTSLVSGLPAMQRKIGAKLDPGSADMMDVMIDCAHRIEELTVDLMDISRVDRAEGDDFRPSDGLRAAVRLIRARLPIGVTVEERIEEGSIIHGRPGDMNQVFLNLLDNAARAVGECGRLGVDARLEGDDYTVRIGDSGAGVEEETAAKVFEPFFTTRPAGEGTGLGLAIVSQVVQGHGGRIELGRSPLGGAEFTVRIPNAVRASHHPASVA